MIDIHCHLLPGLDDGPRELEEAVAMARAYVEDGVTHVVATPHVFPGRYNNVRSAISREHVNFQKALALLHIPLSLGFAGEVRLTPEALDLLAQGELPLLDGKGGPLRALLLELPDGQVPIGSDRFIAQLRKQGITPVVAHPERNRGVMEKLDRMQPFVEAGCLLQLTAGSLLGDFGTKAQITARRLLDAGWAHVVASDAHNLVRRPPRMTAARAWLVKHHGEATAEELTRLAPARLCGLADGFESTTPQSSFPEAEATLAWNHGTA